MGDWTKELEKVSLKTQAQVDFENLDAEVTNNYKEITSNDLVFNRKKLSTGMYEILTKADFLEFYNSRIKSPNIRRLNIQVIGNINENEIESEDADEMKLQLITDGQNGIKNLNEFINGLRIFPLTKNII